MMISDRARAWLQLFRLPNVFTAVADPIAGALAVGAGWRDLPSIFAAVLASSCFYMFGMVLNDWYDYRRDVKERPDRPLPSGRIRKWQALTAALFLMLIGLAPVFLAGAAASAVSVLLVCAIVMYDILLKEVPIAPGVMGLCRSLNLLLGMVAVDSERWTLPAGPRFWMIASLGLYVCGVTTFARREARTRQGYWPAVGAVVTWCGVLAIALLPTVFRVDAPYGAGYLWAGVLLTVVGYRMVHALVDRVPQRIQPAVKSGVLGIILFDAAIVGFTRGLVPSLPLLLLLIPALWLGKWLYST